MEDKVYIDFRHSLPVAWNKETAYHLIAQNMGWFLVDLTKWRETPSYEPQVIIRAGVPSFTYIKHAYVIEARTIQDAVEAIAKLATEAPETESKIEVKVHTPEAPLDEHAMIRLWLHVPNWGEEV